MKLTNKTGLPEPLARVAEKLANNHPVFDKDKYSVTEVLKSTRQVVLAREHASEIEQDIQDTFSMWNGTAIHALLESEAVGSEYEAEQRIEAEIDGVVISGGFDLFYDGDSTLYDYKTSKVATIERQRKLEETKWLEQLYLYKILRERNGMSVPKKGVIIAMATDFSKIKAGTQMGYPEHPIQMLEWELNDKEFEEATLNKAVERAKESREYLESGDEPPLCTYSDCWCTEATGTTGISTAYIIVYPTTRTAGITARAHRSVSSGRDCRTMRRYVRISPISTFLFDLMH